MERVVERVRLGVGESAPRVDGVPKVKGAFAYGSDLWAEGMLWGHTLRSPHPSARIVSVDISEALVAPGVHAVLLAGDIPGRKTFGLDYPDQPVLAWERVRYAGEPVALVAAEHPEQARRAAERIRVTYEPLPAVTDMEEALQPEAPKVHGFGNVVRHVRIVHGEPDAPADVWVEGYYETGMQDQAPLGPEAGLAVPAEDGGVDLYVATQWLHVDRRQIAPVVGLPEEKVRLHLAGVGGAFGSREDVHMQIHACLLALHTGRPVKMSYGREESFFGHVHRHPARIWMRTGATRDGRLVAVRCRFLIDGGAYTSSSPFVIANASTFACGPYEVPNALIEGTAVYTNNPPCGAMRGFGAVQAAFAYEAQMDRLARELDLDPVELRLRNALRPGSVLPTGQVIRGTAPVRELLERVRAMPLPQPEPVDARGRRDPITLPGGVAGNVGRGEGLRRGVGYAVGYKNVGYSEGFDDYSTARVRLAAGPEGRPVAEVHTAAAEVGQGVHTVAVQVARTVLRVEDVVLHPPDTLVGSAGSSSASRQTMMTGGAVEAACRAVLDELLARVRRARPDLEGAELMVVDGEVRADGVPVAAVAEFLREPIEATREYHHRRTTTFDQNGQGDIHVTFSFAAARAVVEVDEELGLVRVVELGVAQDVGRAINPRMVEGQVEGGSAMGLGLALMEELQLEGGRIRNASFTDYLIPTVLDMPPVRSTLVEEPEPGVPFGAKGVGEPSTVVVPAAVAAALRAATGRELNRIPVRPDDLVGLSGPVRPRQPWPPSPRVPGQRPVPEYVGLGAVARHDRPQDASGELEKSDRSKEVTEVDRKALAGRDYIETFDWTVEEIEEALAVSLELKEKFRRGEPHRLLPDKTLFMLFLDKSTRTRNAFEAGMTQLGGHAHYLDAEKTQVAHGESPKDMGIILSRYGHGIAIRHDLVPYEGNAYMREVARWAEVPVINLQCDLDHPTQTLADLMTIREKRGENLRGLRVAVSWAYAPSYAKPLSVPQGLAMLLPRFGVDVVLAYPEGWDLMPEAMEKARRAAEAGGGSVTVVHDMDEAFREADVVYPKSWGRLDLFTDEREALAASARHREWICDVRRMALARPDALYMHCLPADRGYEVTDEVIDGPRSVVYDEAENRLHTGKALLALTMGGFVAEEAR